MRRLLYLLIGVATLAACSTIDCPLNNTVYAKYVLRGPVTTLPDMLTISTMISDDSDSVLINQQENTDSFSLPMSYNRPEDVLVMQTNNLFDTIKVEKTNTPHFESPDCPTTMFHQIKSVRHTSTFIDSVTITRNLVDYDQTENIRIHL